MPTYKQPEFKLGHYQDPGFQLSRSTEEIRIARGISLVILSVLGGYLDFPSQVRRYLQTITLHYGIGQPTFPEIVFKLH